MPGRRGRGRELSLVARIQQRLVAYYGLEEVPDVAAFVRFREDIDRERLLVRDGGGELAIALELPAAAENEPATLDGLCQVFEGVSHFVLVAERARCELPVTQLELELQAEIDKFVLLGVDRPTPLATSQVFDLRARLFDGAAFIDEAGSEKGDRYRMANRLAARMAERIDAEYLRRARFDELQRTLRRFYRVGQTGKLGLARAA